MFEGSPVDFIYMQPCVFPRERACSYLCRLGPLTFDLTHSEQHMNIVSDA